MAPAPRVNIVPVLLLGLLLVWLGFTGLDWGRAQSTRLAAVQAAPLADNGADNAGGPDNFGSGDNGGADNGGSGGCGSEIPTRVFLVIQSLSPGVTPTDGIRAIYSMSAAGGTAFGGTLVILPAATQAAEINKLIIAKARARLLETCAFGFEKRIEFVLTGGVVR